MSDEFYVGYQKAMPPGMAAFLRRRVALLIACAGLLAAVLAGVQGRFAVATFEFGVVKSFTGVLNEHPYPTLTLSSPEVGGDLQARSRYYLVAPGKHGAQSLVAGLDGSQVSLRGSLIYRDGKTMIEVKPGTVMKESGGRHNGATSSELGMYTLRGEIVDSKCFLGVMKPGNLKPHKSCAIRCISGGIPPVLCVRDEQGQALYVTLAGTDARAINRDVLPFVAESVEITGMVERMDDMLVMRIDPAMIRRL